VNRPLPHLGALALAAIAVAAVPGVAASAGGGTTTSLIPPTTTSTTPTTTSQPPTTTPQPAPAPLRVISVSPRSRGTVAGDVSFTIRFSAALRSDQKVAPRLAPALAGRWRQTSPRTLRFTPSSAYAPGATVHLTIPRGIRATDGAFLKHAVRVSYRVGQPSPARLTQLLADLHYLPVHFVARHDPRWVNTARQMQALYSPPAGRFVFGHGWPGWLHELWARDNAMVIRAAVMAFEAQHGMAMDGSAGPQVWSGLLGAIRRDQPNRAGYTYAIGSEGSPETLTVYHNGSVVVHTLANTGIPSAPTAQGTFTVYQRLQSQVMKGTNPDGSHYADFVQWVAYFNGGDAVHYIARSSWGYPQSLGCIEVPYAAAERAWGYLTLGTLITVTG
jgi:hypothetical protein